VDPYHLPLADASVDALLLVHALEYANKPANYLREAWRVLAPGGQIIVIAPNRMRTWSAAEATPFGHGRPYSKGQLFSLMEDQMLPPEAWETALMQPPLSFPGAAGMMRFSERVVGSLGRALGGALLVSARKQVYGALPKGASKARAVPIFTQTP
jgi:SAM-dependent methyltransferase